MKPRPRKYDKQIDEILRHFDFKLVSRRMKQMKWVWSDRVPGIEQTMPCARRLLETVAYGSPRRCTFAGTGGFEARWAAKGVLELSFVVTSYTYGEYHAQ